MQLGRTRRVHFVGVGGSGMSGIAELLANLGYEVSGSDTRRSDVTDRLAAAGVSVFHGHAARHVGDADVVVVSSAIGPDNPEIAAARARRIPVIPRAEMLAEMMRLRVGIAVAGAHGKTTTTSMIALMLEEAGLDPTAVIGGRLSAFGSNARLGRGRYMVAEADESDRSFLKLSPTMAVVTNVDREHMDAYGSFAAILEAFAEFGNRVPFYGAIIACADDAGVRDLLPRWTRPVVTYGFAEDADVRGIDPASDGQASHCRVVYRGKHASTELGALTLRIPGRHALQNALAAIAVGIETGVPFDGMARALAGFRGAERRYERRGSAAGIDVIDDYGHHPTEIAAVLRAARDGRPERIVVAFQPHRYSRTRDLLQDFGPALAEADVVVLTDIYAAGEAPIAGADLAALADAVRGSVRELIVVPVLSDVASSVAAIARPGDVVITLGAGSIGTVGDQILALFKEGTR